MQEALCTSNQEEARALDLIIKNHINEACSHLVESALCLKKMRDTKMYLALGFKSFGDYTQESLNIKERQAYTYISTYESLGERFLQSNANLGITKLSLLAGIPSVDRDTVVEGNDVAGMTVDEVKALVAENSSKGEQINMLEGDIAEKNEEISELTNKENEYLERIRELEGELENEKSKPTEVAVREPSLDEIAKIQKKAEDKANKAAKKEFKALEDKLTAEHKKKMEELEKIRKADIDKYVENYKKQLSDIDKEKAEALKRAEALEKQLAVSSSAESVKFKFYFESIQNDATKISEALKILKEKDPEVAEKFKGAYLKYLTVIKENIEGA